MKKYWCILIVSFIALGCLPLIAEAYDWNFAAKWSGRFFLATESTGEVWYVSPINLQRYYLGRPADALGVMQKLGRGISNQNFANLTSGQNDLFKRLSGQIVLQVESAGQAWYLDPVTQKPIYLGRPIDAWNLMRQKSMGISKQNLSKIKIGGRTVTKPARAYVRGLYLTASTAGDPVKLATMIKYIKDNKLNAVVIDIKDERGYVTYNSQITGVPKLSYIDDLAKLFSELHQNNIYVICRQVVFLDSKLAAAKPNWAIMDAAGGSWRDANDNGWTDPTVREVWDYNLAISREAISAGADEINFDYVRFPSDGAVAAARYHHLNTTKNEAMKAFYEYIGEQLENEPAWISVDFFGLTMDSAATGREMGIGQRLVDARWPLDYIYPMAYPSHYGNGYLGFANPAEHPYEVIANGLRLARPTMGAGNAKLRVWIQAFDLGAVYDPSMIKQEIKAVEDDQSAAGWVMWNKRNEYQEL